MEVVSQRKGRVRVDYRRALLRALCSKKESVIVISTSAMAVGVSVVEVALIHSRLWHLLVL